MDQSESIEKAKQFAQTAYAAASNDILREHQHKLAQMRAQMASRGMVQSGMIVSETARIVGEQIRALIEARLIVTLEGYEAYRVPIDDQLAATITGEIMTALDQMVAGAKRHSFRGAMPSATAAYPQMVSHNVGVSPAWVKTQIDRRRLMPKKLEGPSVTTIYNVQGDNARWNTNSNDNSVNIITRSSEEIFADLRERIASEIPEGNERRKIVESLTALQESHGKPSFAHRYTEFIATAANHVTVIAPFIPALTQMLHHVLK